MMEGDVCIAVESFYLQKASLESIQALEDTVVYWISYDDLQAHLPGIFPPSILSARGIDWNAITCRAKNAAGHAHATLALNVLPGFDGPLSGIAAKKYPPKLIALLPGHHGRVTFSVVGRNDKRKAPPMACSRAPSGATESGCPGRRSFNTPAAPGRQPIVAKGSLRRVSTAISSR